VQTNYNSSDLIHTLREVGIMQGDIVFCHVDLGALGIPEAAAKLNPRSDTFRHDLSDAMCETLLAALRESVGAHGTILIPTFSYSFTKNQPYDPDTTPSDVGEFTNYFRQQPDVIRSANPIFSVAGCGARAHEMLDDLPTDCFGADSVFDRIVRANAKYVLIGTGVISSTLLHHPEQMLGVPYRFLKLFSAQRKDGARWIKESWLYNVRIYQPNCATDVSRLEADLRSQNQLREARVGRSQVMCINSADFYNTCTAGIMRDAWYLATGPALSEGELVAREDTRREDTRREDTRTQTNLHIEPLNANASMSEMVRALWQLPREIVSAGYDVALDALTNQLAPAIQKTKSEIITHKYASGTPAWTWIVPERWTCHEAYLETLDGKRLFSYADHPLHVVSYSLPFEGVVSRDELLAHLHTHPTMRDAIPFKFKYYERDWGLCCTQTQRDALTDAQYRVVIRSEFSYSHLKVAEVIARGKHEQTFVLCAHLCHPHMVNDDLSGCVVGVEVMRQLLRRADLNYTYRLLILPETIGSVAWLSHNEPLVPHMIGGLFLEMLGTDLPFALQRSFADDTALDRALIDVLQQQNPANWHGAFRTVIGNDERQFNAPGVRVPMLSLSRVLPQSHPQHPYAEYHSDKDTPDIISQARLEESAALALKMIEAVESSQISAPNPQPPASSSQLPIQNLYKGEVFCSRYGIHIDYYTDPEGNRELFKVMNLIDGTRTVEQIAARCGASVAVVERIVNLLRTKGLASVG
jgi:aminopeptidase-like protein/aminoglycoside N3'-acetyltransferase